MRLLSPRKSRSELEGQSCRALPSCASGNSCQKLTHAPQQKLAMPLGRAAKDDER
jgi:hypothetical protein